MSKKTYHGNIDYRQTDIQIHSTLWFVLVTPSQAPLKKGGSNFVDFQLKTNEFRISIEVFIMVGIFTTEFKFTLKLFFHLSLIFLEPVFTSTIFPYILLYVPAIEAGVTTLSSFFFIVFVGGRHLRQMCTFNNIFLC